MFPGVPSIGTLFNHEIRGHQLSGFETEMAAQKCVAIFNSTLGRLRTHICWCRDGVTEARGSRGFRGAGSSPAPGPLCRLSSDTTLDYLFRPSRFHVQRQSRYYGREVGVS